MAMMLDGLPTDSSFLTRWDPRWKIAAYAVTATTFAFLQNPLSLVVALLSLSIVLAIGRLDGLFLIRRGFYLCLFLIPFITLFVFTSAKGTEALALRLVLRAGVLFLLAVLFVATTRLPDAAKALSSLGVPQLITSLFVMVHRFLHLIAEEARRMQWAMRVRGVSSARLGRVWATYGLMMAALMLRAEDRAARVSTAMRCRGFRGEFRSLGRHQTRRSDVLLFGFFVGLAFMAAALDRCDLAQRMAR